MSRFDREEAVIDRLHDWGQRHRALDVLAAWCIATAAAMISLIGPLVGMFTAEWLFTFDPDNGAQIAAACLGGSATVGTLFLALSSLGGRTRNDPQA